MASLQEETCMLLQSSAAEVRPQGGEPPVNGGPSRSGWRCLAAGAFLAFGSVALLAIPRRAALRGGLSGVVSEQQVLIASTLKEVDRDIDYEYSHLAGAGVVEMVVSPQDCSTLCLSEPTCKAFGWVSPAALNSGNPGQCWLKGGDFLKRVYKRGVISAFVRDPAVETMLRVQFPTPAATSTTVAQMEAAKASATTSTATTSTSATSSSVPALSSVATETTTGSTATSEITSTSEGPTATSSETSTSTATQTETETTSTSSLACCAFEPLKACGVEAGISEYCDVSQERCEKTCAGKWLAKGPSENAGGLEVDM